MPSPRDRVQEEKRVFGFVRRRLCAFREELQTAAIGGALIMFSMLSGPAGRCVRGAGERLRR